MLHYAHTHPKRIIHRDLKPCNILVDEHDQPHATDFGLAQRREGGDSSGILMPDKSLIGTPAYMSPEQLRGAKLGPQSDVFSAGIILYDVDRRATLPRERPDA